MEEWKEYRLGDFMEFNPKISLKKNTVARKITMDQLVPHSRDIYSWTYEPYSGGAKFQNGDTIMARITPCLENGKHAFISLLDENEVAYGSTEYIVIRGRNGISDNLFIYYLSHVSSFKEAAVKSMVGSSGRQRAQVDVLENLTMMLPALPVQRKIAKILSKLDDKIAINKRVNDNLEQQAQALFKSWFVDFEPFKNGEFVESELGMIPKGWRVGKLGEICNVFTGKKDVKQSQPIGLYPFFSCSPNHTYSNEYIYDGPSIIIAGNGSYTGRTSFYFGKFDLYQRTYACIIKEGFNEKIISFLYYMMKCLFEPVKMGGTRGSSIPYIVMNDIVLQKFALDNSLVEKYSDFAYNVMKQIQQNNQESRRLAELRDTLLPKLMSGELKVFDKPNDQS
jgi:type I restriction enzyme S subunit